VNFAEQSQQKQKAAQSPAASGRSRASAGAWQAMIFNCGQQFCLENEHVD